MIDDFVYYTHPDNVAKLRAAIDNADAGWKNRGLWEIGVPPSFGVEIIENPLLKRDKPTGRYILPGGALVERDAVRVDERFWSYGPEDIPFLLYSGIIREQHEMLVMEVRRSMFRVEFDAALPRRPRNIAISSCT